MSKGPLIVHQFMAVDRLMVKLTSFKMSITGDILKSYATCNHSEFTVVHTKWVFIRPIV